MANVIAASYSDYDPSRVQNDRPVSVDAGHNVNVDPRFVAPGHDYWLRFDSEVIDRAPARAAGARDLNGHDRSVDAHRVGDGIVDMGAFEYQGTGPHPVIRVDTRRARVGEFVIFGAGRSSDPDGGPLTYAWKFAEGNQAAATGRRVAHVYARPGNFRVYLRVTNYAGQQEIATKVIHIRG
jgi:hypothetical protein